MLTITEAQKFLGISRHSIEYKCRKGLIPGAELRDRVYLIPLQWAEIQQRKMIDMSNMLTITQAQKMLGCPRQSLQRYCNLGRIQGTVQIGNTYHIPREWVENELNGAGEFKWYRNVRSSKKDGKIPNFGRSGGKLSFRQAYEIMGVSSQTIINAIKKDKLFKMVREFHRRHLKNTLNSNITMQLTIIPYPRHSPLKYWACRKMLLTQPWKPEK